MHRERKTFVIGAVNLWKDECKGKEPYIFGNGNDCGGIYA
jgi:hypothetical protein